MLCVQKQLAHNNEWRGWGWGGCHNRLMLYLGWRSSSKTQGFCVHIFELNQHRSILSYVVRCLPHHLRRPVWDEVDRHHAFPCLMYFYEHRNVSFDDRNVFMWFPARSSWWNNNCQVCIHNMGGRKRQTDDQRKDEYTQINYWEDIPCIL